MSLIIIFGLRIHIELIAKYAHHIIRFPLARYVSDLNSGQPRSSNYSYYCIIVRISIYGIVECKFDTSHRSYLALNKMRNCDRVLTRSLALVRNCLKTGAYVDIIYYCYGNMNASAIC